MIRRFSLYGFLKNQRYFEPFLILFLLDKLQGYDYAFTVIGVLVGFREVCINLMEIPTGVLADQWGRRRSMVAGWVAYIISFVLFGLSRGLAMLFIAMFFFAIGEAFRTGTHKAMIFTWLRSEGRIDEKTRVYGYTRSWSKIGSAVSVIIAGALVFISGSYAYIFWITLPPYFLGLLNLATYPSDLEGEQNGTLSWKNTFHELFASMKLVVTRQRLRGLLLESMGFEGTHRTVKDYIQPMLKQAALGLALLPYLRFEQRSAVLISGAYLLIYIASALGARYAYKIQEWSGCDHDGARRTWGGNIIAYLVLLLLLLAEQYTLAVVAFIGMEVLQNIWRPILMSRFDEVTPCERQATVLSVESQAKSLFTMIAAPLIGVAVDTLGFWPIGLVGLLVSLSGWASARRAKRQTAG